MLSTFVAGEGPFFSFFEISFFPDASRGLPFANRFDGLGPRLRDQQNRATLKSECFAQFAAEVFRVGRGKKFISIHKYQEGWGRLLNLGGIEEF